MIQQGCPVEQLFDASALSRPGEIIRHEQVHVPALGLVQAGRGITVVNQVDGVVHALQSRLQIPTRKVIAGPHLILLPHGAAGHGAGEDAQIEAAPQGLTQGGAHKAAGAGDGDPRAGERVLGGHARG